MSTRGWECLKRRYRKGQKMKGLTLEGEIVRNPSMSLSPTLTRNEKVENYIRIKTHKPIALRFWVESGVSGVVLHSKTPSVKPNSASKYFGVQIFK